MSKFLTDLDIGLIGESTWRLNSQLEYQSDLIGRVVVPAGFKTDLASVPRVPLVYLSWGGRAHREAVIHDYLYRIGSKPPVTRGMANKVFLEAMACRDKPFWVRWPMYLGVVIGGGLSYHKVTV